MDRWQHMAGFFAALLLAAGAPAGAVTFVVDQLTDDNGACTPGACSLREAILAANDLPGVDEVFLPPGVHDLTIVGQLESLGRTGDLNAREPVAIRGSAFGATVIDGNGLDRILEIVPFFSPFDTYTLTDLTFRGGKINDTGAALNASGAIFEIERCLFENNQGSDGGALYLANAKGKIGMSTFRGNVATGGGGAIVRFTLGNSLDLLIENTTISGNSAATVGGGMVNFGDGILTLRNITVANNASPIGSALFLDHVPASDLVFESSVLQGSCTWASSTFPAVSLGGNLESPGHSCFLTDPSDRSDVADLGLGPLTADGGGFVHPLLPGSPAIEAAPGCPAEDQRGAPRPQDGDGDGVAACDSGAFELGAPVGLAEIPVLAPAGLVAFVAAMAAVALRRLKS